MSSPLLVQWSGKSDPSERPWDLSTRSSQIQSSGRVTALLAQLRLDWDPENTRARRTLFFVECIWTFFRAKCRTRIDEIAEFTVFGGALGCAIKTYSSGVIVRLSFAASTCIASEILLMDEWLSAGDESFLDKAQKRMEHFVGAVSILVLASHSVELLKQ